MRALLLAAGCLAMVGCTFGAKTCDTSSECAPGTCEFGFCVDGDGGTGGAMGGGGGSLGGGSGGGSMGGGSGGGSMGGGGGGGSQPVCSPLCAAWEECVSGGAAAQCQSQGLVLGWTRPNQGEVFGPATAGAVPLRLVVTKADGGSLNFSGPVPFTLTGRTSGEMTFGTTEWAATVDAGFETGPREVVAGWTGGPMTSVRFFDVDTAGPRIRIEPLDAGYRQFMRNERVPFVVQADEALSQASLTLGGVSQVSLAGGCPVGTCVPANACQCFVVDMADPPLPAMSGGFLLGANVMDVLANPTSTMDGGLAQVTRLRWQRPVSVDPLRAAPALGQDGTLYVGSQNGADNAGSLYALAPNGNTKAGWPDAGVAVGAVQGLAVSTTPAGEAVFFSANGSLTRSLMGARLAAGGGLGALQPDCVSVVSSKTYSGIGLMSVNLGNGAETVSVGAMGLTTTASGSRPYAYRSADTCINPTLDVGNMAAPDVPMSVASATNVGIDGTTAFFVGQEARVFKATVTSGAWTGISEMQLGAGPTSRVFSGMALYRSPANQLQLALGSAGTLLGFHSLDPSAVGGAFSTTATGGRVGIPSYLPRATTAVSTFAGMAGAPPGLGGFSMGMATGGPTTSVFASSSPVLGMGGLGYLVDGNGQLTVFSTSNFQSTATWQATVLGAGTIAGSPTLDCTRGPNANPKVGVLYFASTSGTVTAVLVDSPKLDDTAGAWPKYQRTAGNAGNTDTTFALNPGCP